MKLESIIRYMFSIDPDDIEDDSKFAKIANQATWLFNKLYNTTKKK